jgi:hypothetical protein
VIAPVFSTAELADISSMTPRQLQWLDEQGYVCPRRSGAVHRYGHVERAYSEAEALTVVIYGELRRRGLYRSCASAVPFFRFADKSAKFWTAATKRGEIYLIAIKGEVVDYFHIEPKPERVVSIAADACGPVYVLALSEIVGRIRA